MRTDNDILSQYFETARSQEPVVSFAEVQAMVSMASASEFSDSFNKSQAHSFSRWVTFYRNTIKSRSTMVFIGVVVGAIISMFYLFNKIKYAEEPGTPKTQNTVVIPEKENDNKIETSEESSMVEIDTDKPKESIEHADTKEPEETTRAQTEEVSSNNEQVSEGQLLNEKETPTNHVKEGNTNHPSIEVSQESKKDVATEKPQEQKKELAVKSTPVKKKEEPKNTWKTGTSKITLPAKASQSRVNLFVKKLQKSGIELNFGTLKFKDGKIDRIQGTMECATAGARFKSDEMDSLTVSWKNIRYSHDPQSVDLRIHSKMTKKSTTSVEIWEIE